MPNKDGTGPEGKGAKTGRQEGKCQGAEPCPKTMGTGQGRRGCKKGRGMGQGKGMGRNAN